MPIDVIWDDEACTRILATYSEEWTWDDMYPAFTEVMMMLRTVAHPVCVLNDIQKNINSRTATTPHMQYLMKNMPDNMTLSIVIVPAPFIRKLTEFSVRLISRRVDYLPYFEFAKNLEEARDLARNHLSQQSVSGLES